MKLFMFSKLFLVIVINCVQFNVILSKDGKCARDYIEIHCSSGEIARIACEVSCPRGLKEEKILFKLFCPNGTKDKIFVFGQYDCILAGLDPRTIWENDQHRPLPFKTNSSTIKANFQNKATFKDDSIFNTKFITHKNISTIISNMSNFTEIHASTNSSPTTYVIIFVLVAINFALVGYVSRKALNKFGQRSRARTDENDEPKVESQVPNVLINDQIEVPIDHQITAAKKSTRNDDPIYASLNFDKM